MKEKLEDFVYDVLDFLINNKWAFAVFFFIICSLISFFFLYPINASLAYGFMGGATVTTIYRFSKPNNHE